ncbi:HAD-superfamily hydrolase, subfamily IA, variant 3 [Ancylobacter novellus DSM 506]|uniref:HAD-superfamily hydrolase, subfamily IA, variant 3 n=1 Tax=Ancylobacter novellus (strain ATCC 8093 / DSM 506 / JCM 20403 / CCM 1077 / IAM 12100 / NBRC 12443 / NCIMB 10456) TaxID=639283 RepID=D7A495_ANCN5|nr:HAD-IA family hydrolase [Ancylobacter novellus]ADH87915.1 HAD-superfamily hydrolase, subfamily IA, variant 3 [Ancylobacter novellus DSM 506]
MNDSAETHTPSPPRLLVFDMDDVMLRYDVDARRAAMAGMAGLTVADVERLIWTSGIEDASDTGELTPEAYVTAIGEALGVPFGREDWLRTRALAMTLDMEMVNLVAALRERVAIALLTNNGFIMREHFDVLVPGLRELFGPAMHVAAEFGGKKPAPAIYKGVAALYGVAPEEAVMIDDKIANVEGALAAGLRAHCFTGIGELKRFLRGLSI